MSERLSKAVKIGLIVAFLAAVLLIFSQWLSRPPLVAYGLDRVEPKVVRAGDQISVYRTFRVTSTDVIAVSRSMVKGDCKIQCEIVDLYSGFLTLQPGEYVELKREHIIPKHLDPGRWNLVFSIRWHNALGGTQSLVLPPLAIDVVE